MFYQSQQIWYRWKAAIKCIITLHVYVFSLKRKKWCCEKMAISFLNFLSKKATIWIFSKLQFFLITNKKLLKSFSRAFNARFSTVSTFSMFIKTKEWQVLICCFYFKLHEKAVITKDHSMSLWFHPAKMFRCNH